MPVIRIARVEVEDAEEDVREIQRASLDAIGRGHEAIPADLETDDPLVWLAYDGEHAIGFAVLVCNSAGEWHLRMSGVLPEYQRQGILVRMLRARLRWARRNGAREVLTYTRPDNAESMRALIRCGLRPYRPSVAYAGEWFVYWRVEL